MSELQLAPESPPGGAWKKTNEQLRPEYAPAGLQLERDCTFLIGIGLMQKFGNALYYLLDRGRL